MRGIARHRCRQPISGDFDASAPPPLPAACFARVTHGAGRRRKTPAAETLRTLLDLCGYQVTVAHSGFGDPQHRLRALAAGFDQHLVKPVDPRLLLYELQTTH